MTVTSALGFGELAPIAQPPEEARTPRRDCYAKAHRLPSHISKMVLVS